MRILVSGCLLGVCCRYDGASKPHPGVLELAKRHELIPICPEQLGGLATPRPPAERQGSRIIARTGADVTEQYLRGAEEALKLHRLLGCDAAVLKEIYDGTFSGTLIAGDGVTAGLLKTNGISVYGESQIGELLK